MANDTITLTLNGIVPLDLYVVALKHFSELVKALADEVLDPEIKIEWDITSLQAGSATTVITGSYQETDQTFEDVSPVEKVAEAFIRVARSMADHRPIPFSDFVTRPALALTGLINSHINEVIFKSGQEEASIKEKIEESVATEKSFTLGVIRGVARTLSDTPRLRLNVYDYLFDKVVYCYLRQDQQERAREAWRNHVAITGLIYREPGTGRPIEVKEVYKIDTLPAPTEGGFQHARGIIPWQDGMKTPEELIRQGRDA